MKSAPFESETQSCLFPGRGNQSSLRKTWPTATLSCFDKRILSHS